MTLQRYCPHFLAAALVGVALQSTPTLAATEDASADAARISAAFVEKGMEPQQSECYGRTIAGKLGPESEEAAVIVETASNETEIREGVKGGGLDMVRAFLAAKTSCGGS